MNRYRNVWALTIAVMAGAAFAGNGCPVNMSDNTPAGSANPLSAAAQTQGPPGPQGPAGPQGPPGPQGPQGPAGTNATVSAGTGVNVVNGVVSLSTTFTDGRYWKQGGNNGVDPATKFLGTTDLQPMDIRTNNKRALRLQFATRDIPVVPTQTINGINVIAGYDGNSVAAGLVGVTLFGGSESVANNVVTNFRNQATNFADYATISGGFSNEVQGAGDTIGGGNNNLTSSDKSTIAGGESNTASGSHSFIGGGSGNEATDNSAVVAGGSGNSAAGAFATVVGGQGNVAGDLGNVGATVGGGIDNEASGAYSTVPGGFSNRAKTPYSFAAGYNANVTHTNSFVWGDSGMTGTPSLANNQFFVGTTGGICLQRTNQSNGFNTVASNVAVMIEKLNPGGEALWIWQRQVEGSQAVKGPPVVKMHRNPSSNNNFVEGYDWTGPPNNNPTPKFHINDNGTFVAGSDFAEALPTRGDKQDYEPGDVVVLSASMAGEVERCQRPYDTKVAGVYSTRPGVLGAEKNGTTRMDENDIPVAITGIVPTKVSGENGPIAPGDLLTTSATPGHAMRAKAVKIGEAEIYPTGAIIGKAIEGLAHGTGKIRVLVTLK